MGKKNKRVRTDDPVRCIAHSSRTGLPCKKWPMKGQNVCRNHGGAAPAARRRAAERIALASDSAAAHLIKWMQDDSVPYPVRLAAAKDLLDRAPVSGKQIVELEVPGWQQILDGIVATVEPGVEMRPFAEAQPAPDPLVVEAERADQERELERYQTEPHGEDWSDDFAYGSEPPAQAPTAPPTTSPQPRDGNPPPPRPRWERDAEAERRRRDAEFSDDVEHPPPHGEEYRRATPRPPRRGRVAGRR